MKIRDLYNTHNNLLRDASPRGEEIVARAHNQIHERLTPDIDAATENGYHLSEGLRIALRTPYQHNQIANRYPWAVVFWTTEDNPRKLRKKFTFLPQAILYHARLLPHFPTATVVSISRGYDIPAKYRGRLPKPWKWCPFCMRPRKYRAALNQHGDRQDFYALVKTPRSGGVGGYEQKERRLLLMECPVCRNTNRNHVFRRANQPWELIRIPRGRQKYRRRRK
jgi:hypothetical protein